MRSFASHVTNSATACQSLQVCKNCARSCGSTMRRMLRSRSHSSRGERGVRHRKVEGVARRAGLRYRIGLCKVAFQGLEVELTAPLLLRFRAPMPSRLPARKRAAGLSPWEALGALALRGGCHRPPLTAAWRAGTIHVRWSDRGCVWPADLRWTDLSGLRPKMVLSRLCLNGLSSRNAHSAQ